MPCRQPERMFTSVSAGNLLITMLAVRRLVGVRATTFFFFFFSSLNGERENCMDDLLFFSFFLLNGEREEYVCVHV